MFMSEHLTEHAADGSGHSIEEAKRHMRTYAIVGVALMIGTLLTVWASYIDFHTRETNIIVALIIASTKASLVAGFFMHLISEKKMVYLVLGFTVFFATGLMVLTLQSMTPGSIIHMQ
jgi:caa(3)-type oxidase subunit IV